MVGPLTIIGGGNLVGPSTTIMGGGNLVGPEAKAKVLVNKQQTTKDKLTFLIVLIFILQIILTLMRKNFHISKHYDTGIKRSGVS